MFMLKPELEGDALVSMMGSAGSGDRPVLHGCAAAVVAACTQTPGLTTKSSLPLSLEIIIHTQLLGCADGDGVPAGGGHDAEAGV